VNRLASGIGMLVFAIAGAAEARPRAEPSLVVDVTETGVALNGYPARDLKELRVRLTDVFGTRADKTLTVKAAACVPYGKLAEVVSLAYQWGVKRVLVPSGG